MDGFSYVCSIQNYKSKKKIQRRFLYRCTKLFISSEADAGGATEEMITNKKQTAAAIKAAVDQADRAIKRLAVKKIKRRNEIRNEEEFKIMKEWLTKKEKQWLK